LLLRDADAANSSLVRLTQFALAAALFSGRAAPLTRIVYSLVSATLLALRFCSPPIFL